VAVGKTRLLCGVTKTGALVVATGGWTLLGLSATIRLKAILITTMMLSTTEKICWLRLARDGARDERLDT
jgi:hypothetical protein